MGIFRDLVSNVANARMKEEQNKLAYNLGLGKVLTNLIQNDSASPGDRAQAVAYYKALLSKHGGKEAKEMLPQIDAFLGGYLDHKARQQASGQQGDQGGKADQDGGMKIPPVQPTPPGGTRAQQGEAATPPASMQQGAPGWSTGASALAGGQGPATPSATLAGQGAQPPAPAAAPQRGGVFRSVLRGLAGVGGEMLGIPKGGTPEMELDPSLFGPTPAQQAQQAGQLAGIQSGAQTEAMIKGTMAAFNKPEVRELMKAQGFTDDQIRDAELRALGIPAAQLDKTPMVVYEPDGTKHNWWADKHGQMYNEIGEPSRLGPGWSQFKVSTDKPGGDQQMATALKASYQSAKVLMTRQNQNPDGTWKQGWDQTRVDKEALVQAAIQYERTSGATGLDKEIKYQRDAALGKLSGVAPPPAWMPEGAEFNAQVDRAQGKLPPSVYDQPVPKQGEPIVAPEAAAAFDEFVMRASGLSPMGGRDEWAQLRYNYGMKIAMAQMGTNNPFDLAAVFQLKKSEAKALSMTVQRVAGVDTLGKQLHAFGDLLEEARRRVDNTGIPLIDRYLQQAAKGLGDLTEDQAKFVGQLDTALNAVARIYSQVLSNNAYVSVSMPHVKTEAQGSETLKGYMSDGTIGGILQQMYAEVDADQGVYRQREAEQFNNVRESLPEALKRASGSETPTATPTPTPPPKPTGGTTPPPAPKTQGPAKPRPKTADELWKRLGH